MENELQLFIINLLVQQMMSCDLCAAYIRISHIERPYIPEGRFDRNNLSIPYISLFRLEMEEFDELWGELRMPLVFHTAEQDNCLSSEALHIVMRRFAFPACWMDLCGLFHCSGPALSRIFHHTVQWILDNYKHLLEFTPSRFAHLLPIWVSLLHSLISVHACIAFYMPMLASLHPISMYAP